MASPRTKERQAAEKTKRAASSRSTGGAPGSQYPGVLSRLKEEHDLVKDLFDQFEMETEDDRENGKATADQICVRQQDEDIYYEAEEEHHVAEVLISRSRG